MSFLTRPTTRLLPTLRTTSPLSTRLSRPFTSSFLLRIKEDADRHPEEVDKIKHEHLDEQKQGKGRWREELASSGESNIAADKEHKDVDDHGDHMEDLQKQGAESAQGEKEEGKK